VVKENLHMERRRCGTRLRCHGIIGSSISL
jgi:hypothetical protein